MKVIALILPVMAMVAMVSFSAHAEQSAPAPAKRAKPAYRVASSSATGNFQCPPPLLESAVKSPEPSRPFAVTLDTGAGIFTGGLGTTTKPGLYVGLVLSYDVGANWAIEAGIHYADHLDSVQPVSDHRLDMDTALIPLTLGARYHFLGVHAPVSPYLAGGVGAYLRSQNVIDNIGFSSSPSASSVSPGAYGGAGVDIELGSGFALALNVRYHVIAFPDADQTFNNTVPAGSRSGNYLTPSASLTFAF